MNKDTMLQWFTQHHWTHSATINLQPQFKSHFVCRQFLRNFNRAVFGRDNRLRLMLYPLTVLPVFADDSKLPHIHFAFGGFPDNMDINQIRKAFYKASKQTKGVMFERTIAGTNMALRMVKIDSDSTPDKWLSYILRHSKDIQDKHIMLDQAYFG
jgi:hypothetical protein